MTEKTFKETFEAFSKEMLDLAPEQEFDRLAGRVANKMERPDWELLYYDLGEDAEIMVNTEYFTSNISVIDSQGKIYSTITNALSGSFFENWLGFQHYGNSDPDALKGPIYENDQYSYERMYDARSTYEFFTTSHQQKLDSIRIRCLTWPLEKLKGELPNDLEKVFKGHDVMTLEYLLINPRKDVVEWALKHKEELDLKKVNPGFIKEYQAIPELKELILNTLEKKGE